MIKKMKWKLYKIYRAVQYTLKNIWTIISWIPVLWNNWDYDYHFLFSVMKYKLKRISKHIKDHNVIYNAEKYSKQMDACIKLIERIEEQNYVEKEEKKHEQKYGKLDYIKVPISKDDIAYKKYGCKYERKYFFMNTKNDDKANKKAFEEKRKIFILAEQRCKKDIEILFRIMNNCIIHWWD